MWPPANQTSVGLKLWMTCGVQTALFLSTHLSAASQTAITSSLVLNWLSGRRCAAGCGLRWCSPPWLHTPISLHTSQSVLFTVCTPVWCPSVNIGLFNVTRKAKKLWRNSMGSLLATWHWSDILLSNNLLSCGFCSRWMVESRVPSDDCLWRKGCTGSTALLLISS